ncbi:hypothetical protein A3K71_01485 [archaeon RBG_16_50_20]|nr:MAG: hypothetical protein A3K71_01485 [archaeon RBG_16_50_20]
MRADDNKTIIERFFEKVLKERNLSLLGDFVSESYVEHNPTPDQSVGIEGVRRHIQLFFTVFSDTEYRLEDIVAEGNKVVARWTLSGMHSGDFLGMPPTGTRIETSGIDIYYLQEGKIKEHWHEMDMLRLMTELNRAK